MPNPDTTSSKSPGPVSADHPPDFVVDEAVIAIQYGAMRIAALDVAEQVRLRVAQVGMAEVIDAPPIATP